MTKKKENTFAWLIGIAVLIAITYCSFHFGSWEFVWNEKVDLMTVYFTNGLGFGKLTHSYIFIPTPFALAFRIGDGYYGLSMTGGHIDSPVISWILLIVSIATAYLTLQLLFGGVIDLLSGGKMDIDDIVPDEEDEK